ncbi:MAG: MFS transporter [Planctomycetes bacterium]|nr:MFS transporter [Planctomycetota bacterium]
MPAGPRRVRDELFGHGRGRVLAFCWLGWVFDFYDLILFAFLKVAIARDLGLEVTGPIAWIDGWTLFATAVGGFWFGRIADATGRRRALVLSILVYSAGAFGTAFAQDYWSLLAARCLTGIGVGGEWGIGHAIVAETYPERLRGRAAGILQAGTPFAMGLAAAVGCFAGPEIGWRACFLLSGLPALLVVFARAALPDAKVPKPAATGSWRELFLPPFARPSAALLALLLVHMAGFWCTYAWMPTALLKERGASPAFVGVYQLGVAAAQIAADVAFGFLADRYGRRRVFAWFCGLFTAGLLVVAWRYQTLTQDLAWFTLAMALTGFGTGTWSCFGVLFAVNYPERLRATAASGFYNVGRGAQLVTQPLMGWLAASTGTYAGALHVGAAMGALSAVLIWLVPDRRRPDEA